MQTIIEPFLAVPYYGGSYFVVVMKCRAMCVPELLEKDQSQ